MIEVVLVRAFSPYPQLKQAHLRDQSRGCLATPSFYESLPTRDSRNGVTRVEVVNFDIGVVLIRRIMHISLAIEKSSRPSEPVDTPSTPFVIPHSDGVSRGDSRRCMIKQGYTRKQGMVDDPLECA